MEFDQNMGMNRIIQVSKILQQIVFNNIDGLTVKYWKHFKQEGEHIWRYTVPAHKLYTAWKSESLTFLECLFVQSRGGASVDWVSMSSRRSDVFDRLPSRIIIKYSWAILAMSFIDDLAENVYATANFSFVAKCLKWHF